MASRKKLSCALQPGSHRSVDGSTVCRRNFQQGAQAFARARTSAISHRDDMSLHRLEIPAKQRSRAPRTARARPFVTRRRTPLMTGREHCERSRLLRSQTAKSKRMGFSDGGLRMTLAPAAGAWHGRRRMIAARLARKSTRCPAITVGAEHCASATRSETARNRGSVGRSRLLTLRSRPARQGCRGANLHRKLHRAKCRRETTVPRRAMRWHIHCSCNRCSRRRVRKQSRHHRSHLRLALDIRSLDVPADRRGAKTHHARGGCEHARRQGDRCRAGRSLEGSDGGARTSIDRKGMQYRISARMNAGRLRAGGLHACLEPSLKSSCIL